MFVYILLKIPDKDIFCIYICYVVFPVISWNIWQKFLLIKHLLISFVIVRFNMKWIEKMICNFNHYITTENTFFKCIYIGVINSRQKNVLSFSSRKTSPASVQTILWQSNLFPFLNQFVRPLILIMKYVLSFWVRPMRLINSGTMVLPLILSKMEWMGNY